MPNKSEHELFCIQSTREEKRKYQRTNKLSKVEHDKIEKEIEELTKREKEILHEVL